MTIIGGILLIATVIYLFCALTKFCGDMFEAFRLIRECKYEADMRERNKRSC